MCRPLFSPFPLRYESFEQIFKSTIKRLDEVTRGRANEIRANWRVPFRKYSYEKIVTFELRILYVRDKERKKKMEKEKKNYVLTLCGNAYGFS